MEHREADSALEAKRAYNRASFIDEIAKCCVLCDSCHKSLHARMRREEVAA